jgi:hypothetical protein
MQLDNNLLTVIVLAIVAIVMGIMAYRAGQPLSIEGVTGTFTGIQDAVGEAREWVLAAEQLYSTGRLTKDQRFAWVLGRLRESFPDLDDDTLAGSIEASVRWAKLLGGEKRPTANLHPSRLN